MGIRGIFDLAGDPNGVGKPGQRGLIISQKAVRFTLTNDEGDDWPVGPGFASAAPIRMLDPSRLGDLVGAGLVPGAGTDELGYWTIAGSGEESWLRVLHADPAAPFVEVILLIGP